MNSKSHCGIPIHFLQGKISDSSEKQSVLFELKGNYTDNQTRSLMIAIQPTVLIFKLPTISTPNVPFA